MALTGKELAKFAKSKVGTPYVYGAKGADGKFTQAKFNYLSKAYPNVFTTTYKNKIKSRKYIGKVCCDCSGLISWYTGKVLGSSQLYSQAKKRMPISQWKDFAVGTVVWKSGHVGVYIGNGKVVEEKGIDYGCIVSNIKDTAWKYGLTFSWMTYEYEKKVKGTSKGKNPYKKPTGNVKSGDKGESVKWVQWELKESGYKVSISGKYDSTTVSAVKKFQKSCKIAVDGICGDVTRKKLIAED